MTPVRSAPFAGMLPVLSRIPRKRAQRLSARRSSPRRLASFPVHCLLAGSGGGRGDPGGGCALGAGDRETPRRIRTPLKMAGLAVPGPLGSHSWRRNIFRAFHHMPARSPPQNPSRRRTQVSLAGVPIGTMCSSIARLWWPAMAVLRHAVRFRYAVKAGVPARRMLRVADVPRVRPVASRMPRTRDERLFTR